MKLELDGTGKHDLGGASLPDVFAFLSREHPHLQRATRRCHTPVVGSALARPVTNCQRNRRGSCPARERLAKVTFVGTHPELTDAILHERFLRHDEHDAEA